MLASSLQRRRPRTKTPYLSCGIARQASHAMVGHREIRHLGCIDRHARGKLQDQILV
jgi:hypothetical protein